MYRHLSESEKSLVKLMLQGVDFPGITADSLAAIEVEEMDDGGMGSLLFKSSKLDRLLGKELASKTFVDTDGVEVIVTLSLDNYGDLFELDVWKVDFSPVISLRPRRASSAG